VVVVLEEQEQGQCNIRQELLALKRFPGCPFAVKYFLPLFQVVVAFGCQIVVPLSSGKYVTLCTEPYLRNLTQPGC
jgi:hypothetical protein